MGMFQKLKNLFRNQQVADLNSKELLEWLDITPTAHRTVSEVTYYTCLKMLSETLGKLPLKYYQQTDKGRIRAPCTQGAWLLTNKPNPFMTATAMWTMVEQNCQHFGNAYVYINRGLERQTYGGEVKISSIYPLQSNCVTVYMDNAGIFGKDATALWYVYSDPKSGKQYVIRNEDMMHFRTWYSFDGIFGLPVKDILKATVDSAGEAQNYMNNLYKQGLTASMALQYTGDLSDDKIKKLQNKFANKLTGAQNAGKVVPIPIGLTLTPLNISLADAQFYELRKYSALQIAGAFGIKPNQINDYDKSSYSNSETQQLAFLVDTMSYRLKMYEEEINDKMLTPTEKGQNFYYKFNEKALLRTDSSTQMENLVKAVNNGIYTPNEAREFLDMPDAEGGDVLMCNGNYIPITQVGDQYNEGGEEDGEN